ncbi:MAG: FAD-dependent monooxygenase [Bdellovibrionales bacterium]|nr:FAD-dependent monooxygenase [Bdellovibrionales bacterium]
MSKVFKDLNLQLDERVEEKLNLLSPNWGSYRILKKSVDARKSPHFVYSLEVFDQNEKPPEDNFQLEKLSQFKGTKPLIIGAGPAGLFAALRLLERGIACTLIEQGSPAEKRIKGINRYWRYGELDPKNNVCFGEGGAGLYSDGKLITRIKSPHIPYVMQRLVEFGAPDEIKYLSNPHVGSDKIRRVIPVMRKKLLELGCDIRYDTKVSKLLTQGSNIIGVETDLGEQIHSNHVVLAIGHSANDFFQHLSEVGVFLEGKSFAMGVRVEHPQNLINSIQYKDKAEHPALGSANYKLTHHDKKTNTGVFSFCMCPGGYVLSSGTEADSIVCNGMSNYKRNSPYANSAVVVTVDHKKLFGDDLFGGFKLRRQIEVEAFNLVQKQGGTKQLPTQNMLDFLNKSLKKQVNKGSSPSGETLVPLHEVFPEDLYKSLSKGLESFENKMKGFVTEKSQVYGVETRTSCPLRITRDKQSLESISHKGLYPTGEGAGYAGGITSAACDGINVADAIYELYKSSKTDQALHLSQK